MRICRLHMFSAVLISLLFFTVSANAQENPATKADAPRYKDATLPIDERVADLLARMTLEEKVDQLATGWEGKVDVIDPTGTYTADEARKITQGEWSPETKLTPRNSAILRNGIQRYLR